MHYPPVHWSEGMFLRPQHFQAADRHWFELTSTSDRWDAHYNYGLREIEISREALANYQVAVDVCRARLRDGCLISLEAGAALDRLSLKQALRDKAQVMVYLAVPRLALGRANVTSVDRSGDSTVRYAESSQSVPDESLGGNDQEIQFRRVRARLTLEPAEGFETIPIARVRRLGHDEAVPELDEEYIPPLIAVDAWPPLALGIVRKIYDLLGRSMEAIAQRVIQRGIHLTSQTPGDLDDLLRLMVINQAYAVLHCITFASGQHPQLVYRELCRTVGMLSIFGADRRSGEIPAYDHDDLATIFRWAERRIRELLGGREQLQYEQRPFIGAGQGLQVRLEQDWLLKDWDWYVGVKGTNASAQEIRVCLQKGKLNWKMGSASRVELIFRYGLPGIRMDSLEVAPRALPANQGWIYYEVLKDPENSSWKDVLNEQTLGLHFENKIVGNLESLVGQKSLEVVLPDKRILLEFDLFAVPRKVDRA